MARQAQFAALCRKARSKSVVAAVGLALGVEDARPVCRLILLPGVHVEVGLKDALLRAYLPNKQ